MSVEKIVRRAREAARMTGSTEDLLGELERAIAAHQQAAAEADEQRRCAQALDRLSTAMIGSSSIDELLLRLLEMFVDVAGVDVAVVRLREGDRLHARAAVGLEDEVEAGFSLPCRG